MTSRERFEAWLESRYPTTAKNPWKLRRAYKRGLFEAWQARDAEVREWVEALRDAMCEWPDGSWSARRQEIADILAKHESDGA